MDEHDDVALRVLVTGRVQGVFFRASTVTTARAHDVVGWVRNRGDGRVEAHLQGREADVTDVVTWMRGGGPPAARVEAVSTTATATIDSADFGVAR